MTHRRPRRSRGWFGSVRPLALLLAATGLLAHRPAGAEEPASVPNAPAIFASQDPDRVRTALEDAVVYLRQLAREDSAGYYCAPYRQQKFLEYKDYEIHYAEKEVDYPIYETYKTKAMVTTGDSSTGSERRLMEVSRLRQIGTKKVKTLVPDANGPEVRKVKYPVYGPGGPDGLFSGFYGQNALAIYAQLLCGVPPEDDQFARAWTRLLDCIEAYGMPDRTWDLAWLTVAAINLPQDTPARKKTVQRLLNKLLLGQITDGPAKGLWGPVCLHTALLSKMLQYQQEFTKKELASWEERLKLKPNDEHLQQKANEAKSKLRKFQTQLGDVTTIGTSFGEGLLVKPDQMFLVRVGWSFPDATLSYAPYNLYAERTADIDSTALALFALDEAARARCLPEGTVIPRTLEGQPFLPAEKTSTIVLRALDALVRVQTKSRPFSDAIGWQPVHDFDWVGLPDLPVKDKDFPELEPRVTLLSAARTYGALTRASVLAGSAAPAGVINPLLARARSVVTAAAEGRLRGETNLPPLSGLELPQEFALELVPLLTEPGDPQQTNHELWMRFSDTLLKLQQKDGAWTRLNRTEYPWYAYVDGIKEEAYDASLLPMMTIKAQRAYEKEQEKLPKEKRKPYDPKVPLWRSPPVSGASGALYQRADVVATAYAMIFLAQGVRPPILGVWAWNDQPARSPVPRAVINIFAKDRRIPFTYRRLTPDLPLDSIRELPLIYLDGSGPFRPAQPAALSTLQYHLQNRGLIVAEAPAGPDGETFLRECQAKLAELAPTTHAGPLPPLVPGVELQGLLTVSNRVAAAFYPVTAENKPPPGTIRLPEVARYTYQLLAQSAEPELLSPAYAIRWPMIEDAERKLAAAKAKKEAEEAAKKAAAEAAQPAAEGAK